MALKAANVARDCFSEYRPKHDFPLCPWFVLIHRIDAILRLARCPSYDRRHMWLIIFAAAWYLPAPLDCPVRFHRLRRNFIRRDFIRMRGPSRGWGGYQTSIEHDHGGRSQRITQVWLDAGIPESQFWPCINGASNRCVAARLRVLARCVRHHVASMVWRGQLISRGRPWPGRKRLGKQIDIRRIDGSAVDAQGDRRVAGR